MGYTLSDEGITKRYISEALLLNRLFAEGEKGNSKKTFQEGSGRKTPHQQWSADIKWNGPKSKLTL